MDRREAVIAVIDEILVATIIIIIIIYTLYGLGILEFEDAALIAALAAAALILFTYKLVEAQVKRVEAGAEALIGMKAEAIEDLDPEGHILVEGEIWRARSISGERIPKGSIVRIVSYNGLLLLVERADDRRVPLQG